MVNSLENFKYVFDKALEGKFIDRMDQNQEIFARYMNDPAFAKVVAEFLRKQVYEQIRAEAKQESLWPVPFESGHRKSFLLSVRNVSGLLVNR